MNRVDFLGVIVAENCIPNGDIGAGAKMPRQNYDGYGEMSDVCIKRKIRNRMQDMGCDIFVQSAERIDDGFYSLKARADHYKPLADEIKKKNKADIETCRKIACEKWIDVRTFGQVFATKDQASFGIKGCVSIGWAQTLEPVTVQDYIHFNSNNREKNEAAKDSTTARMEWRIDKGVYIFKGQINSFMAEKNNFSKDDMEILKNALKTLLVNDESYLRPVGSMSMDQVFWWEHNCKLGQYPPIKVFNSVKFEPISEYPYYTYEIEPLKNLTPELLL